MFIRTSTRAVSSIWERMLCMQGSNREDRQKQQERTLHNKKDNHTKKSETDNTGSVGTNQG